MLMSIWQWLGALPLFMRIGLGVVIGLIVIALVAFAVSWGAQDHAD